MTGQRLPFTFDKVFLCNLWSQTDSMVDRYAVRVREAKDVDAASQFCRWLLMTGLLEMLRAHPSPFPLRCDGAGLALKVRALIADCGEQYTNPTRPKTVEFSEIESINQKLAVLMAAMPKAA